MTTSKEKQYTELKEKIGHIPRAFKDLATTSPDMHGAALALDSFVWADGALSRKAKKLIAISIAAALRDTHATKAQLTGAKNLGITLEEIDEALRVAFMLSGMPAYVQGKSAAEKIFKKKT